MDDAERSAEEEARRLVAEFGADAPVYAAMKARRAIEKRDYARCARWRHVLALLDGEEEIRE